MLILWDESTTCGGATLFCLWHTIGWSRTQVWGSLTSDQGKRCWSLLCRKYWGGVKILASPKTDTLPPTIDNLSSFLQLQWVRFTRTQGVTAVWARNTEWELLNGKMLLTLFCTELSIYHNYFDCTMNWCYLRVTQKMLVVVIDDFSRIILKLLFIFGQ